MSGACFCGAWGGRFHRTAFHNIDGMGGPPAPLAVNVYGLPAPQGSKRHVGNGRMIESSKKVAPWRAAVRAAITRDEVLFPVGPLRVWIEFFMPRPRSHYGTGRNADVLKENAPMYPTGPPDVDKMARSTLDAITEAGIWRDDAQVVYLIAQKLYTHAHFTVPGARIYVAAIRLEKGKAA